MKIPNYSAVPITESSEPLVELGAYPFLTEAVQFRRGFTANPQLWVRQTVAMKLEQVQRDVLDDKGLRFKIFDAWRPRDVQDKIYAACWNEIAQANPKAARGAVDAAASRYVVRGQDEDFIPPHTTGGAVDLTLVLDATGAELEMGTPYLGWHLDKTVPAEIAAQNLRELVIAMNHAGFTQDPDQWWHFDYGNQKWAAQSGAAIAVYGEVDPSMGFMKKGTALGHGVMLPYELR